MLNDVFEHPVVEFSLKRICLKEPLTQTKLVRLSEGFDQAEGIIFSAAPQCEAGMWLEAHLVPSLGIQLVTVTLKVTVVSWFEAAICELNLCRCVINVSALCLHNLACRTNAG